MNLALAEAFDVHDAAERGIESSPVSSSAVTVNVKTPLEEGVPSSAPSSDSFILAGRVP